MCVCVCVCVDVGVEHVTKPVIVRTSEQTFEHLNKDGHNIYKHPIICRRQTTLATLVCRRMGLLLNFAVLYVVVVTFGLDVGPTSYHPNPTVATLQQYPTPPPSPLKIAMCYLEVTKGVG